MSYQVAVRALCEFTAKQGDLDLRFTPSPTAQEGITGHMSVVARRGSGYIAELPLSGEYKGLLVRGRADGYCWKKSKPTVAISRGFRKTTGCCIGRR